jgi:hypothetical protein
MDSGFRGDRIIRTAAWLYVVPRALKGFVVFAIVGLAGSALALALALSFLRRHGS